MEAASAPSSRAPETGSFRIGPRARLATAVSLLLAAPMALHAQQVTRAYFYYDGQNLVNFNRDTILWQPTGDNTLRPGFNLSFFGKPDPAAPCTTTQNGSTLHGFTWANSATDTGIVDGVDKWTPNCGDWQGFTYARVHNGPGGGIGMQTYTGKKPYDESPAFWQPYGPNGDQYGANANLMGTFGTFRFDLAYPNALMRPWSGNSPDHDVRRFAVRSTQLLKKIQVQGAKSNVQQGFGVSFLNLHCMQGGIRPGRPCQLSIGLHSLVVNTEGTYSGNAHTFQDPAQAQLPVIYGAIGAVGQSTTMACPGWGCGNSVWTSWWDPTQHGHAPWPGAKTFQVEISFNQLQRMLAVTAASAFQESYPTVARIKEMYGNLYNDPEQWVLLDIGFSQEIHNKDISRNRVHVGANTTKLEAYAVP